MSWIKDEENAEVIKLEVGETVEGLITDKTHSTKYDATILKLKVKDDDTEKVILCPKILEKKIATKEVGQKIKIERLKDTTTGKGQTLQVYETYTWTEEAKQGSL